METCFAFIAQTISCLRQRTPDLFCTVVLKLEKPSLNVSLLLTQPCKSGVSKEQPLSILFIHMVALLMTELPGLCEKITGKYGVGGGDKLCSAR